MEVTGKVKEVQETKVLGDKGFRTRGLVVVTEEKYPQTILIEFTQDNVSLIGTYKPGDEVTVAVNLRGREWTSPQGEVKYFTSLNGWKIDKLEGKSEAQESVQVESQDDLPF